MDKKQIIIIVSCVSVLFVCLIAVLLLLLFNLGTNIKQPPALVINGGENITVENNVYTLSGSIQSHRNPVSLYINGELVETVMQPKTSSSWEKTVELTSGANVFVCELIDNNRKSESKTITVTYAPLGPYEKGTLLVKSVKDGIYVRPDAAQSDKIVLHILKNDYTTTLTYLGETRTDADGVHTWLYVSTPSNGNGWVRSDIVRAQ